MTKRNSDIILRYFPLAGRHPALRFRRHHPGVKALSTQAFAISRAFAVEQRHDLGRRIESVIATVLKMENDDDPLHDPVCVHI
jgi:hypothetical protein